MAKNFVVLDAEEIGPKGVASPRAITAFKHSKRLVSEVHLTRLRILTFAAYSLCLLECFPVRTIQPVALEGTGP